MSTKDYKNFLKDIGLEFNEELAREILEINDEPQKSNVINMATTSLRMDDSRIACCKHLANMLNTYGMDIVEEAFKLVKDE